MRLTLFSLILFALLVGCNKESLNDSAKPLSIEARGADKVLICHKTGNGNSHVLEVSVNALSAHLGHGDVVLEDADGDGFYPDNDCGYEPMGDCDDSDPTIYPGAPEICGDSIDQDCDGADVACLNCPVFTTVELHNLISYQPNFGWWLDENTCYNAPLDLYQEVYLYFPGPLGGTGGANTYDFKDGSGGVAYHDQREGIFRQHTLTGSEFQQCKMVLKMFMDEMKVIYPSGPVIDKCNL